MSKAKELLNLVSFINEVKTKVLTRKEAEELGKKQVEEQNEIMKRLGSKTRYKFIKVGNLDECWDWDYKNSKYYKKYHKLLVWRLDKTSWNSDKEGKEWRGSGVEYVNEKGEYWYVVADLV